MEITSPTDKTIKFSWQEIVERIVNNFVLRRIVKAIFTVWVVASITFFVIRAMPGSAIDILIQDLTLQGYSPDDARNQAASLMNIKLDEPVYMQYIDYLGNVAQGDFGNSYRSRGLKVTDIILQVLPWTVFSVGLSLIITFTLGIALGAIMAYTRDSWIDLLLSNLAAILDAISPYIIGLLAILFLSVITKIIPYTEMRGAYSSGMQPEFSVAFLLDILSHMRVLVLAYVLSSVGSWMLIMKSNTITTLGEDYVTAARARGLPDLRILSAYVGRNATLPLFTRLAITIGFAVGGSVLLESLFTYRGIGFQLAQAIAQRDYPIMQGIFIVITAAVVLANLIADLLYGWLDPRIRVTGGGNG
jgi:peptide/nickel transport system permease protein